ncbi:MAG: transposase [Gemmatimonadota bacterium]
MGRRVRPHMPGATFHLTSRLHDREALFTPKLRTGVVTILRECVAFADLDVFAYVVMPNHLHLVVRQGEAPLSRFMQPLLRRTALLIQRSYGREGHVFERPYRDKPCASPYHLRNAIVYTHLNPVRAGLCAEPGAYAWSSYGAWVGERVAADGRIHPIELERASPIFACGPGRTTSELRHEYLAFERWRREQDRLQADRDETERPLPSTSDPWVAYGDAYWASHLAPLRGGSGRPMPTSASQGPTSGVPATRPDLSTIARGVVGEDGSGLNLALVRSRWGGPPYVRARHRIIRRAAAAGYRGVEIARYLRISTTAVSDVLVAHRKRLLLQSDA